jgi:hypothetical protein
MEDDPLEAVHAFVERAYIRLQAGEVIMRCMDVGSTIPIHQMVEGLILSGPQNLGVLREMLVESGQRKIQIIDDLHQVINDLKKNLKNYGVQLSDIKSAGSVSTLSSPGFLELLKEQGVTDQEVQSLCLRILNESLDLIDSMSGNVVLLEDIELYLSDWLWGLAYQSAHKAIGKRGGYQV